MSSLHIPQRTCSGASILLSKLMNKKLADPLTPHFPATAFPFYCSYQNRALSISSKSWVSLMCELFDPVWLNDKVETSSVCLVYPFSPLDGFIPLEAFTAFCNYGLYTPIYFLLKGSVYFCRALATRFVCCLGHGFVRHFNISSHFEYVESTTGVIWETI